VSGVTVRALRTWLLLASALAFCACHSGGAAVPAAVHEARRLEFDPGDGRRLLVVERGGDVSLWRLDDPAHPVGERQFAAQATDARFLPGGQGIASGGADGHVRRWGLDGTPAWTSAAAHGGPIRGLAVGPDRIASAGEDGSVRLWTFAGEPAGVLATDANMILAVAFSAHGDWLAAEGGDTQLRLWRRDPTSGAFTLAATFRPVDQRYATLLPNLVHYDVGWGWDRSLAFAPDGTALAAADFAGTVQRWSMSGEAIGDPLPSVRKQHIRAIDVGPNGQLAAAVYDGSAQMWSADGGTLVTTKAHNGVTTAVAFSPDGSRLATAGIDGRVKLWTADGRALGALPMAP
jgi:WD40 repeat protein